jgi:crossover junction endodeoxyribonuclease RuvC
MPGVRVLGVDPGSRHCGWGVIERSGARCVAVAWGRLSPSARRPLPERLGEIAAGIAAVIAEHRPDHAAVERVFHGVSTRSLIVLAESRGAVLGELGRQGIGVSELAPAEIKSAVAGSGRADKAQVARMVALLLALPGAYPPPDATDALAAALACAQREGFARRVGPAR